MGSTSQASIVLMIAASVSDRCRWTFGETKPMKIRHYLWCAALALSAILTLIGMFKGAAVLLGISTPIEIIVSVISGKKTNT